MLTDLWANTYVDLFSARANSYNNGTGVWGSTYSIALMGTDNAINQTLLRTLTHGNMTVQSFEQVIEDYLLPNDIKQVLLDIGWQDFNYNNIPYQAWVDDWLTACDYMGIQNLIFVAPLTPLGIDSTWVNSFLNSDPSARTFYSNGTLAPYFSPDNNDVLFALERNVHVLYNYYGRHTSWIGLSIGDQSDPYYLQNGSLPIMGYSNYSIENFLNSVYYKSISSINQSESSNNSISAMFENNQDLVKMSSGVWMTSSSIDLTSYTKVEMKFLLNQSVSGLRLSIYGNKVGNPAQLNLLIYPDNNNAPSNTPISSLSINSSTVTSTTGWQGWFTINESLLPGFYWIELSDPFGNSLNHYTVYLRDFQTGNDTAAIIDTATHSSANAATILWVQDITGRNIVIYPYMNVVIPSTSQIFIPSASFYFNTVILQLSDRSFNPFNGTIVVKDLTTNTSLAAGTLSQSLVHGLEKWVPIQLNTKVFAQAGHIYELQLVEPQDAYWYVVLRGLETSPNIAGFEGQSEYWLFKLAMFNVSSSHVDFEEITSNGMDAIRNGYLDAVRIIPGYNETLYALSILMKNLQPNGQTYNGSDMTVAIRNSVPDGSAPGQLVLHSVTIAGTLIPQNGWLNISGLDTRLTAGTPYWIVFSSSSNVGLSFARLTSSYSYLVLVSDNNGTTWKNPKEGPTEFAFIAKLTNETLGNPINDIPQILLTPGEIYAQPFKLSTVSTLAGIFIGEFAAIPKYSLSGILSVSIHPDNGHASPSATSIASGYFYSKNETYKSAEYIGFTSLAWLGSNTTYWIEVSPIRGSFYLYPDQYVIPPMYLTSSYYSLLSNDSGMDWSKFSNLPTLVSYILLSDPLNVKPLSTETLYDDIALHFNYDTHFGSLTGWNAYLQTSEIQMFNEIAQEISMLSGRSFYFYVPIHENVIHEGNFSLVKHIDIENIADCAEYNAKLSELPMMEVTNFIFLSGSLNCSSQSNNLIKSELSRLVFIGGPFGQQSSTRVLLVSGIVSSQLYFNLNSLFNVTYLNQRYIGDLQPSDLASFNYVVLLLTSEENASTQNYVQKILKDYVTKGGNVVIIGNASVPYLLGFNWNGTIPKRVLPYTNSNSELVSILRNTSYSKQVFTMANLSISAAGIIFSNGLISLNRMGNGSVFFIYDESNPGTNLSLDDQTLIDNILSSDNNTTPIYFQYSTNQSTQQQLFYSVLGNHGRLMLWMYNPTSNVQDIVVNLDSNFFGVSPNTVALDPLGLYIHDINPTDLKLNVELKPNTWTPIYIFHSSTPVLYSNSQVYGQYSYPGQVVVRLQNSLANTLLIVRSNITPSQVMLNNSFQLNEVRSQPKLSSSGGWFYNQTTRTLFVTLSAGGNQTIRIFYHSPSSSGNLVLVYSILFIIIIFIVTESIFSYYGNHQGTKSKPEAFSR
ncbi:MAG: hypothetical protein QXE12_05345 [Conexivisphaerales archaeon]